MPKYVLTGADGNLGRVAASWALETAAPGQEVVLTTYKRSAIPAELLADWEKKGAKVEEANYDDVESMKRVFEGAEVVAFISTWLFGEGRRKQAANVIAAAKATGVKRISMSNPPEAQHFILSFVSVSPPFGPRLGGFFHFPSPPGPASCL